MRIALADKYYSSNEYQRRLRSRFETLKLCEEDELHRARMVLDVWSVDPISFIEQFLFVKIPNYNNAIKPFFMFDYQKKIIHKLMESEQDVLEHTLLIDKPREMGVTYTILAYCYWRWLFTPNWSGFLLSRTETEVDDGTNIPDNSMFGKIRWMISMTPKWLLPEGFVPKGKKGTNTDMGLKIINPALQSALIGSTTNASAGRSRRYTFTYIDEAFFIEHFHEIMRSIESVSRVKCLSSSAQPSRKLEKFKESCELRGDYLSLKYQDHPWKDEIWFKDIEQKAIERGDMELMREAVVSYAIPTESRYYPQIVESKVAPVSYDPKRPLYMAMDTGRSDLTVLLWCQYNGGGFNIIECVSNKDRGIEWYAPFINKELSYNPTHYHEKHRKLLEKIRTWGKPVYLFSGLDVKAKKMPTNRSIEQHLYPYIHMKIVVNNYAEGHDMRRTALSTMLPLTTFNEDSDYVMELYDAIANSQYTSAVKSTSKKTAMTPIHGTDGTADYRSCAEYLATNLPRVLRRQRSDQMSTSVDDLRTRITKMLRV